MLGLGQNFAGAVQAHPIYAFIVPPTILAATWAINNKNFLIAGKDAVVGLKDCVVDHTTKKERDNYLKTVTYLKDNIEYLSGLNFTNYDSMKDKLQLVVTGVRERNGANQWISDLNERTKNIWEKFDLNTRKSMQDKGIVPSTLSLENLPKSSADLALWVKHSGECANQLDKCLQENEKNILNNKNLQEKVDSSKDQTIECKDKWKEDADPLRERKGECKDLDSIKEKNIILQNEKDKCLEDKFQVNNNKSKLESENENYKKKIAELQKELEENKNELKKWTITRWIGW